MRKVVRRRLNRGKKLLLIYIKRYEEGEKYDSSNITKIQLQNIYKTDNVFEQSKKDKTNLKRETSNNNKAT